MSEPNFKLWSLADDLDNWLYDNRHLLGQVDLRPVIAVRDALDIMAKQRADLIEGGFS